MFHACIMGASFTTGNMGVSALAASLVKLILMTHPEANITFFIPGRISEDQAIEVLGKRININISNFRLSPKSPIGKHLFVIFILAAFYKMIPLQAIKDIIVKCNACLKVIANADFVGDIRGGDSFSDIYGLNRITVGSMPSIIALLLGKKLVLLPQTYGPYDSKIAKCIAGFILRHSHAVLSRDRQGIEVVKEILEKKGDEKKILFCPDVAFVLDSTPPENLDLHPFTKRETRVPLVGLNINGLMYNGGYTRDNMFRLKLDYKNFVHALSKQILETTNINLLLIPHTFAPRGHVESDSDACEEVFNALSDSHIGRIQMIEREYNEHSIKGIIGLCDFFIGSRMHACIAALSQGIPTVGVAYSLKFMGVFDSVSMSHMIVDARTIDEDTAVKKIQNAFEDRDNLKSDLDNKIESSKVILQEVFRKILVE